MKKSKIFIISILYLTLLANIIGGFFSAIYSENYREIILWIPFILPILLFESIALASIYFVYNLVKKVVPKTSNFYACLITFFLLMIIILILESLGSKGINMKESMAGFIQLVCGLIVLTKYTLPKLEGSEK
jgi:lysylphosphatidylglycerol synthetase-like protein (DUF2156 family)